MLTAFTTGRTVTGRAAPLGALGAFGAALDAGMACGLRAAGDMDGYESGSGFSIQILDIVFWFQIDLAPRLA
jgi:hypothetical protein